MVCKTTRLKKKSIVCLTPPSYAHTPAYQRCAVVRWCNPLLVWSSTWHGTSNFFLADMCVYVRMRIDGWVRLQLRHASGAVTVAQCMREGLPSHKKQEINSRRHERGYPFLGLWYTKGSKLPSNSYFRYFDIFWPPRSCYSMHTPHSHSTIQTSLNYKKKKGPYNKN